VQLQLKDGGLNGDGDGDGDGDGGVANGQDSITYTPAQR